MSTIHEALRNILLNDSTIYSYVQDRIMPTMAGQNTDIPVIIYDDIIRETDHTLQGQSDLTRKFFSFKVIASQYKTCVLIINRIVELFNPGIGLYSGVRLRGIIIEDENPDFDSVNHYRGRKGLFSRELMVSVNYQT